jgi:hypothetical protein
VRANVDSINHATGRRGDRRWMDNEWRTIEERMEDD